MKKLIVLIVLMACLLTICGCSSNQREDDSIESNTAYPTFASEETSKPNNSNNNGDTDSQTAKEDNDIAKEIVGNWYFWTTKDHLANMGINSQIPNSITFNNDLTFEYELGVWDASLTESKTQKIQGTYSISNNKISMIYNQTYKTGFENELIIEDKIDDAFSLIDNEITIGSFGIYVKEGETLNPLPDCSNEYSRNLEGYYICDYINGEGNDYFHFNEKGQINRIAYMNSDWNCEYDYVYNDFTSNSINGMVERDGGDSECRFQSNYTINEDGSINLFNTEGKQYATLNKIDKDTFDEVQKDTAYYIGNVYFIKVDVLNVREQPSTSSKVVSTLNKGDIRYASYEPKTVLVQTDGYTWYRIDENEWIADKNGEWVQVLR